MKKIKLLTALGLNLLSNYSVGAAALVEREGGIGRFSRTAYNALPTSHEADRSLQATGALRDCLEDTRKVVEAFDAELDYLGFRLAHRHNDMGEGEVMVERYDEKSGDPRIVTSNEVLTEAKDAIPASWIPGVGGYVAFEYAVDPMASAGYSYLSEHSSLLPQIIDVVDKHELRDILAPAVIGRDSYKHFQDFGSLMETGSIRKKEGRVIFSNILKGGTSEDLLKEGVIITNWGTHKKHKATGCKWFYVGCGLLEIDCGMIHEETETDE